MENISYGKIVLIGAGHVGSAILDSLLRMNLADEIVVINRNEKVDDHCFLSEPPSKQRQNQLRCKPHKNGIILLQGHCAEFAIDVKQPAHIALFRTAEDIDARSGFPQLCDFLGVSQVIQIFGGNEKHVFSSVEMHA